MNPLKSTFIIGQHIDRGLARPLERLDWWIRRRKWRAGFLLLVLILAYSVTWSGVTFLRHYYFHTGYDLAIFDQVIWNTANGRPFSTSIEVTNSLGDHAQPYLALLSPVYLAIPSPYVLLAFQSFVLALSAWPIYRLGRRKFSSPAVGLTVAFCALAYPPLGFVNRFDFHPVVVAVPLLIAAYERIDVGDLKSAAVFLGLALFAKEDIGLTVAALGFMVALYHKRWFFGLTWITIGVTYSLVALFVIIPWFRGEPSDTIARYQWLGDAPAGMVWTIVSQPGLVLKEVLTVDHLLTCVQLLAPLAFLPLLALPVLFPAVPTLASSFLSQHFPQTTIYFHYMAPVIPFMIIAAVLGLHRLSNHASGVNLLSHTCSPQKRPRPGIGLGLSIMVLGTLASWTYENPITGHTPVSLADVTKVAETIVGAEAAPPNPIILSNDTAIREGIEHVPEHVHLLTTSNYASHLSQRRRLQTLPRAPVSKLNPRVEAILLNLRDLRKRNCDDYLQNLQAAAQSDFGVTFYRESVLLVQRGQGDLKQLKELLDDWPGCG